MIVERFPFPSPLLRFPTKPSRPCTDASAASSHPESHPPLSPPRRLIQVGGLSALLGLPTSQASPSSDPPGKASPLPGSLLTLEMKPPHDDLTSESQGLSVKGLALSSRRRRRPVWLSSPVTYATCSKPSESFGLFFHLGQPNPFTRTVIHPL